MPEYEMRLHFTAADGNQASRLASAWADTCAAEYGTRSAGLQLVSDRHLGSDPMNEPTDGYAPFVYDGSFDLSFLRENETVESTGHGDGSCWLTQRLGPDRSRGCRIDVGETVERLPDGTVISYDATASAEAHAHG